MIPNQTPEALPESHLPVTNIAVTGEQYISNPITAFITAFKRLWATNFTAIIMTSIIGAMAVTGTLVLMLGTSIVNFFGSTSSPVTEDNLLTNGAATGWLLFAGFVLLLVIGSAVSVAVEYLIVRAQNNDKLRVSEALSRGFRRFGTALLAMILVGIIVIVGLLLLIVPGVYLALRLSYTLSVVANENLGVIGSIKRSFALTKGRVGDVIGAAMISAIIALLASILLELGGTAIDGLPAAAFMVIMLIVIAGYSLISLLANITLSFRYHQSDLASRGVISKQGTDPLNYLLILVFIGTMVLSGFVTYSLSPDTIQYNPSTSPTDTDIWLNET